jgi:hypothetical protein
MFFADLDVGDSIFYRGVYKLKKTGRSSFVTIGGYRAVRNEIDERFTGCGDHFLAVALGAPLSI